MIRIFNKKHDDQTQVYVTDEIWVIGFEKKAADSLIRNFTSFHEWCEWSNGLFKFETYMRDTFPDNWQSFLIENNLEDV